MANADEQPVKVRIIKVGTLCLEPGEADDPGLYERKYQLGIGGGSTVTAIETPGGVLLADTGFEFEGRCTDDNLAYNRRALLDGLALHGLAPRDITAVFLTHLHHDHFGNLHLFPDAERLCSSEAFAHAELTGFRGVSDGEELAPGVTTMFTPGHTADHCSMLVDTGEQRLCIAGDAVVSFSYFDRGRVWDLNPNFLDHEVAQESMDRIARACDIIVPGHGVPFRP